MNTRPRVGVVDAEHGIVQVKMAQTAAIIVMYLSVISKSLDHNVQRAGPPLRTGSLRTGLFMAASRLP